MLAELIAVRLHDSGHGVFTSSKGATIFIQCLPDVSPAPAIGIFETSVRAGPVPHHRTITARVVVRGRDRAGVRDVMTSLDGWKAALPAAVSLVRIDGPNALGVEQGQERWAFTLECVMPEGDI